MNYYFSRPPALDKSFIQNDDLRDLSTRIAIARAKHEVRYVFR